jgi:sodium-dependent dicarboxylate transporter 2/3/5
MNYFIQSVAIKLDPLYLMVPATLVCSYSFRLPVGTPPNAIVTIAGHMPVKSLILGGCGPAIYSVIILMILFPTFGSYVYQINDFPDWANPALEPRTYC